jgi:hypothetical protein
MKALSADTAGGSAKISYKIQIIGFFEATSVL